MREEREQPFNKIVTFRMEDGQVVEHSVEELPEDAFSEEPFETEKEKPERDEEGEGEPSPEKIQPELRAMMDERPYDRERVVINLLDDLTIPRFPQPVLGEPHDSEANREVTRRAEELIAEITSRRAGSYERLAQELAEDHGAETLETYWLVKAMLVEMPLSAVPEMAEREDVLYISADEAGYELPTQPGNPFTDDDIDDGRALMATDPYFNLLGLTGGFIGLIDSGVRSTHTLFTSPNHLVFMGDCVNGGGDCLTLGPALNPTDDCTSPLPGHGTCAAAIITANNNLGNAFRGVTRSLLDSWKVSRPGTCTASGSAILRAFQAAVRALDFVIAANIGATSENHFSPVATAADNAFDAGAAVIVANGNTGPGSGTVESPANAHKAIGVGMFDVRTGNPIPQQSVGPTGDGRTKPDVQAPTNAETADNSSDTSLRNFGGTSCACPYAAGAAALVRAFLLRFLTPLDPGQIYAYLILSGQTVPFNDAAGAGPLVLPTNGTFLIGKVSITHRQTINIPLTVGAGITRVDGAIWWPEEQWYGVWDPHDDIDLHLIDPSGSAPLPTVMSRSLSIPSVFERVRATGNIIPGTWTLSIRGFNVPLSPQTVYFAAHFR